MFSSLQVCPEWWLLPISGLTGIEVLKINKYQLLGSFSAVLGTGLFPVGNPGSIQAATNGVVTNTRQVLDPAAPDQDHGVFLQVVTFTTDVRTDFIAVGQAYTTNLTQC